MKLFRIVLIPLLAVATTYSQESPEPDNLGISRCMEKHLPAIKSARGKERYESIHTLGQEMQQLSHSGIQPGSKSRESLSINLLAAYNNLNSDDPEDAKSKGLLVETIARFGAGKDAEEFVRSALKSGDVDLRKRALSGLRSPHVGVKKADMYEEIAKLEAAKTIQPAEAYRTLRWLGPERARQEMNVRARKTKSKQEFMEMAWLLQSYEDPSVLSDLLPRVAELRLDEQEEGNKNSLYWIDKNLFARYMQSVEGAPLISAVDILAKGGGSVLTAAPILIERNLISHENPEVRKKVAIQIRKAADGQSLPYDKVETILRARLSIETDAGVKKEIQEQLNALSAIQRHREQLLKRLGK